MKRVTAFLEPNECNLLSGDLNYSSPDTEFNRFTNLPGSQDAVTILRDWNYTNNAMVTAVNREPNSSTAAIPLQTAAFISY